MNTPTIAAKHRVAVRPQPLGIFGGAADHLLLPWPNNGCGESGFAALNSLLKGCIECEDMPDDWRFFQFAIQGELETAWQNLESLARVNSSERPIHFYNQFVLRPSREQFDRLRNQFDGELRIMLDATAYSLGTSDLPPRLDDSAAEFVGDELKAWILATTAAADIDAQDFESARDKLKGAAELAESHSPLLAAMLAAQGARLGQFQLNVPAAIIKRDLETAIRWAESGQLPGLLAELWTQLGMLQQTSAAQSREGLLEAVKAYQAAIQSIGDPHRNPLLFAELQNNLGLAYLAMTRAESSDRLRYGIAIQSFRRGIELVDRERDDDLWARINMNLASALQYAPSSHPAENLVQAVEIYEQVLSYRSRARDPVAYALVLINQANALAHLGMFKPSLEKAAEAYKLFLCHDQVEQATTARELVEQINEQLLQTKEADEHGTS
ncbi:MAG TPA: hypothetical protein PKD64_18370 [Pirellulaceae bacterium]|nr:hypothetical protein [Pirellulaceae bacterium]HMO94155.1 hypothetical protein [Pirellulaceae bacterium]HMP71170.1 hypothetical protein [Pirellulaceae bacterium]